VIQQDIAAAADAAVRKYYEDTTEEEKTEAGVTTVMRISTKDATDKLYKKLSKIVSIANPALGDEWLQEVKSLTYALRKHFITLYIYRCSSCLLCPFFVWNIGIHLEVC